MSAEVDLLREQVVELQSQLAFQEDAISGLDAALARQQQEIMLLRRQLELLHQRLWARAEEPASTTDAPEAKPPHY